MGTTGLHRRLGLKSDGQAATDPSIVDIADSVRWSPFLEWFTMHGFIDGRKSVSARRLVSRDLSEISKYGSGTVICLLPHALKAANTVQSSVHRMLLTTSPVSKIVLSLSAPHRSSGPASFTLIDPTGVTIGDLLNEWLGMTEPECLSAPVSLWLAYSVKPEVYLIARLEHELALDFRSRLMKLSRAQDSRRFDAYAPFWSNERRALARDWYKRTSANDWFQIPMAEQSKIMRNYLKKHKAIALRTEEDRAPEAAWPALGLTSSNDIGLEGQRPYEVEFAAGVVFNRLE